MEEFPDDDSPDDLDEGTEIIWRCDCGYVITHTEKTLAKFEHCPRCKVRTLEAFKEDPMMGRMGRA